MTSQDFLSLTNILPTKLVSLEHEFYQAVLDSDQADILKIFFNEQKQQKGVIVQIKISKPQKSTVDIRNTEDFAIVFSNQKIPEIISLRQNFPRTIHVNPDSKSQLPTLCLYDQPASEMMLTLTGKKLLVDIISWLERSVRGNLHQDTQALEPLFVIGSNFLEVPNSKWDSLISGEVTPIALSKIDSTNNSFYFKALAHNQTNKHLLISLIFNPIIHGYIHPTPESLGDLDKILKDRNLNFTSVVQDRLAGLFEQKQIRKNKVIFFCAIPVCRNADEEPENWLTFGIFILNKNLEELIIEFGVGKRMGSDIAQVYIPNSTLGATPEPVNFSQNLILPLQVLSFNQKKALDYSGIKKSLESVKITQIGVGALGSNILNNFIRMGIGKWEIVDDDLFLPHNLTRHTLPHNATGYYKTQCLEVYSNMIHGNNTIVRSINDNYWYLLEKTEFTNSLKTQDYIIDTSTSIAVMRSLSLDIESQGSKVCSFFNPKGTDGVLFFEGSKEKISLDSIEAQYYRFLIENDLKDHLMSVSKTQITGSCRDATNHIPQDNFAILSGLITKQIREIITESVANPKCLIYSLLEDGSVNRHKVEIKESLVANCGKWTIKYDVDVKEKLNTLRKSKLPKETGGVLVGFFDIKRKIVYVVDVLESPRDSIEDINHFQRGLEGVKPALQKIEEITSNQIQYIGEWHSHPDSYSTRQSSDDLKLHKWIKNVTGYEGRPGLMIIVGQKNLSFYL